MKLRKWLYFSSLLIIGSGLLTMSCSSKIADEVKEVKNIYYETFEEYLQDENVLKNAFEKTSHITNNSYVENIDNKALFMRLEKYQNSIVPFGGENVIDNYIEYTEDGFMYDKIEDVYYPAPQNVEESIEETIESFSEANSFFKNEISDVKETFVEIMENDSTNEELHMLKIFTEEVNEDEIRNEYFVSDAETYAGTNVLSNALYQTGLSKLSTEAFVFSAKASLKVLTSWITTNWKAILIAALLAVLLVIIISNWSRIKPIFGVIIKWFVDSLKKVASTVINFFSKAGSQAEAQRYKKISLTQYGVSYTPTIEMTEIKNMSFNQKSLYAAIRYENTLLVSVASIDNNFVLRNVLLKSSQGTYTPLFSYAGETLSDTLLPMYMWYETDKDYNGVNKRGYFWHWHGSRYSSGSGKYNGHSWYGNPN